VAGCGGDGKGGCNLGRERTGAVGLVLGLLAPGQWFGWVVVVIRCFDFILTK
jgi:hypothetical protein